MPTYIKGYANTNSSMEAYQQELDHLRGLIASDVYVFRYGLLNRAVLPIRMHLCKIDPFVVTVDDGPSVLAGVLAALYKGTKGTYESAREAKFTLAEHLQQVDLFLGMLGCATFGSSNTESDLDQLVLRLCNTTLTQNSATDDFHIIVYDSLIQPYHDIYMPMITKCMESAKKIRKGLRDVGEDTSVFDACVRKLRCNFIVDEPDVITV